MSRGQSIIAYWKKSNDNLIFWLRVDVDFTQKKLPDCFMLDFFLQNTSINILANYENSISERNIADVSE